MIEAIFFDKDGTLLDSEGLNVESALLALRELGVDPTEEDIKYIYGRNANDIAIYFTQKYEIETEVFKNKKHHYYHYKKGTSSIKIFSNMVTLVKVVHSGLLTVGLVTSARREGTLEIIKNKLGLENVFDLIVTADDVMERKPSPEPYLLASRQSGVKVENCLVFEDSLLGLQSAKSAGMKCILVSTSKPDPEYLALADFVIHPEKPIDLDHILSLFS